MESINQRQLDWCPLEWKVVGLLSVIMSTHNDDAYCQMWPIDNIYQEQHFVSKPIKGVEVTCFFIWLNDELFPLNTLVGF